MKRKINDVVTSVGFPVGVCGFVIAWGNIITNQTTMINIFYLWLSTFAMFFMYDYNLRK